MQDWLDDPENRIAYERFLEECEEEEQRDRAARKKTARRRDTSGEPAAETQSAGTRAGTRSETRTGTSAGTGTRSASTRRRRRKKRRGFLQRIPGPVKLVVLAVIVALLLHRCTGEGLPFSLPLGGGGETAREQTEEIQEQTDMTRNRWYGAPSIDVQLLTPNEYSRPQISLPQVNGIVVHYTANPGSTAQNNRNYFENLKDSGENSVSSHFVIGLDGEIIQCVPCDEVAYASNERNSDTISIECCHPDETGKFNDATYQSLVELTAWLCSDQNVPISGVIRHYDVTGKNCPKYFVENEDAWRQFKADVQKQLDAIREGKL